MASTGKAYLFSNVINFVKGEAEDKEMATGLHKVADIFCKTCMHYLGWYYIHAYEED